MKQLFTKTLLVLAVSLISIGLFAVKTNALTISAHDCYNGTTTKVACTVAINSITVGNYTDNSQGNTSGLGHIDAGTTVPISWSNISGYTGEINHYEVYSGCSDNSDPANTILTYNFHIGNTPANVQSINWTVPNQKYCKIWVYAKDTVYSMIMMNAIGVSNTRFIDTTPTTIEKTDCSFTATATPSYLGKNDTQVNISATNLNGTTGNCTGTGSFTQTNNVTSYTVNCPPADINHNACSRTVTVTKDTSVDKTPCTFSATASPIYLGKNDTNVNIYTTNTNGTGICHNTGSFTQTAASATYSVNCDGDSTHNACSNSVTVTKDTSVDKIPCIVSINASPIYLGKNDTNVNIYTTVSNGTGICHNTGSFTQTAASATYSVNCDGDSTHNACSSNIVTVTKDTTPNNQVPVVTLNATSPITAGQATNLSWYTSNYPTSCIATSSNGYWTGSKNISSGNESVTLPVAGSYTFTITCSNSAGTSSDTRTVVVNTTYQNITVDLTASPTTITSGQYSTLTWYSANATYCTASGAWSGSKNTSGSETVYPTSSNNYYAITCYNNGNQASDNTTVYVTTINNQLPTVTLTANPTYITAGQTSTLNWYSTNANYCTASGDWSGSKSTYNGSETIYPIKTSNYYTIVCTNNYGSTSASATVNVTALPPIYSTAVFAKTGRDLSAGDRFYSDNISVNSGDVVEFYLTVNISSYNGATNIIVTDPLPYNLIYRAGTTKVNGVTVADGITGAGLYLGNLSQGTIKTITFQAVTRTANYGTIVTNTAQLRADNIATLSDGANVNYNKGTVLGAETVDTGPSQVAFISLTVALLCTGAVIYAYNKNAKFQALFEGAKAKVVNSKIAHWQL